MDQLFEFALSVKAVQRELERRVNDAMQPLGVTAAQADAIVVIGQAEPLALKELGSLMIAEAGHPSRLVDRLVEAGVVERRTAAGDRRRVELSLTAKGRRLNKRILTVREDIGRFAEQLLAGQELEPALAVMRELVQHTAYGELIARRTELSEAARSPR